MWNRRQWDNKVDSFMQDLRVEHTEAERDQKHTHRRWGSGGHQSPWKICDVNLLELNPQTPAKSPRATEKRSLPETLCQSLLVSDNPETRDCTGMGEQG